LRLARRSAQRLPRKHPAAGDPPNSRAPDSARRARAESEPRRLTFRLLAEPVAFQSFQSFETFESQSWREDFDHLRSHDGWTSWNFWSNWSLRFGYVVLENPPSTMMISPVTKRLCRIRLSMLSATSSSVQQRLSGVYLARRSISPW